MNNTKFYSLQLIIFLIILLLIGCNAPPLNESLEDLSNESLNEEISYWSSNEFQGRQTGTEANSLVGNEIAEKFEKIGLEPIQSKGYLMPFKLNHYNPEDIERSLVVNFNNGKKKEFSYGTDWLDQYTNYSVNIQQPISFTKSEGTIFITDNQKNETDDVSVKFVKTKNFHKQLLSSDSKFSTFQISDSVYNFIEANENEIKNVHIIFSAQSENITAQNVAGKIDGEDGSVKKQAIVISAHFDHVGTAGNTTFLGSVDNATGITGLMNLASILKKESKEKPFSSDILFVAFNAEENGLVGSQAFVNQISPQYESIININLDCIGIKDGGRINFVGTEIGSVVLSDAMKKIANENNIDSTIQIEETASLTSDHISFINANYQAINISQERFDKIHTTGDNLKYTDSKPLKSAIVIVHEFVHKNHNILFETNEILEPSLIKEMEREKKDLNFAEYKLFSSQITNKVELAYNLEREMSQDKINQVRFPFSNESIEIKKAYLSYEPFNKDTLYAAKDPIDQVKKMRDSDMKLSAINLTLQKDNTNFYIQIFEGELEDPNQEEIDTFGKWKLIGNNDTKEEKMTYNIAISPFEIDKRMFTVIIQNFNEDTETSEEPYSKSMIENFLTAFKPEGAIKVFLNEEKLIN